MIVPLSTGILKQSTLHYTHTAKILIQELHVSVQYLQRYEFIVVLFNSNTEIEASIPGKREEEGEGGKREEKGKGEGGGIELVCLEYT